MPEKFTAKVGDWIRFMQDGRLVIGEVRYLHHNGGGSAYLITEIGSVPQTSVHEIRSPLQSQE